MLKVLQELSSVKGDEKSAEYKTFKTSITSIGKLAGNVNKTLDTMLKAEENWFWGSLFKIFK